MTDSTPLEYRVGTCSECAATFKVPASFAAKLAKCKQCGKATVEIGPVIRETPKPAPVPAQKPAEDDLVPYVPSGKKRDGMSMKERLKAQRAAAAQGQAAPAKAAAAKPKPAAKPAPKAAAKARPAASAPRKAAAAAGAAAAGGAKKKPAGASRRRGGASTARRRTAAKGDEGEGGAGRSRTSARGSKKKSPAPAIGAVVILGIVGFGVWWQFLRPGDQPVNAADGEAVTQEVDPSAADTELIEEVASEEVAPEETPEEAPEEIAEEDSFPEAKTPKAADPSSVDLTVIEDFGPVDDTGEEEWAEIQELVTTYLDPGAGAAGNRAGRALEEAGKKAMPALVNALKDGDFATEEGYRTGDITQRLMMKICNGTNLGWKYSTEPKDVVFNKKVAKGWAGLWERAENDPAYWRNMAKIKDDGAAEEAPPAVSDEELDALDDLEDL